MAGTSMLLCLIVLCILICMTHSFVIRLHVVENPRTIEEMESITCWTCPGKSDNEECNDWAPERQCHQGHSWCKTVHRFNQRTGRSILVNKECVRAKHCTIDHVGCYQILQPNVVDCVTCCNKDYCNEFVPVNHTSAVQQSSYQPLFSGSTSSQHPITTVWITTALVFVLTNTILSII